MTSTNSKVLGTRSIGIRFVISIYTGIYTIEKPSRNCYCNKWLKLLVPLPPRPSLGHKEKGKGNFDSEFSDTMCAVD